jgi:hypothetical protein
MCRAAPKSNEHIFFVQYAGGEDFTSDKQFSQEWKISFEYQKKKKKRVKIDLHRYESPCTCPRPKQVKYKNYFTHWPKFLFVLASNSIKMLKKAQGVSFTIGDRYLFFYHQKK